MLENTAIFHKEQKYPCHLLAAMLPNPSPQHKQSQNPAGLLNFWIKNERIGHRIRMWAHKEREEDVCILL